MRTLLRWLKSKACTPARVRSRKPLSSDTSRTFTLIREKLDCRHRGRARGHPVRARLWLLAGGGQLGLCGLDCRFGFGFRFGF
eukprot:3039478-Prymnesium_polylepis.1